MPRLSPFSTSLILAPGWRTVAAPIRLSFEPLSTTINRSTCARIFAKILEVFRARVKGHHDGADAFILSHRIHVSGRCYSGAHSAASKLAAARS